MSENKVADIQLLRKGLSSSSFSEQKASIKVWVDAGGWFTEFFPGGGLGLNPNKSVLGHIIDDSKDWKELIFHCFDEYKIDPYTSVNHSNAHCALHYALKHGNSAVEFVKEWSNRGYLIDPKMQVQSSPLGVIFSYFAPNHLVNNYLIAKTLLDCGANITAMHVNIWPTIGDRCGNNDSVAKRVWFLGLESGCGLLAQLCAEKMHLIDRTEKVIEGNWGNAVTLAKWFGSDRVYWSSLRGDKYKEALWGWVVQAF